MPIENSFKENSLEKRLDEKYQKFSQTSKNLTRLLSEVEGIMNNSVNLGLAESIINEQYILELNNSLSNTYKAFQEWQGEIHSNLSNFKKEN